MWFLLCFSLRLGGVLTENSVRSENGEVTIIRAIIVDSTMSSLFVALFALASSFRTRAGLQVEILAFRHQLAVFQKNAPRRLRLQRSDRGNSVGGDACPGGAPERHEASCHENVTARALHTLSRLPVRGALEPGLRARADTGVSSLGCCAAWRAARPHRGQPNSVACRTHGANSRSENREHQLFSVWPAKPS